MLVAIDEYGSITLPALLRKALGLEKESYLSDQTLSENRFGCFISTAE